MRKHATLTLTAALLAAAAAQAAKPKPPPRPLAPAAFVGGCSGCQTWWPLVAGGHGEVLLGWHLLPDHMHYTLDRYGSDGSYAGTLATLDAREFVDFAGAVPSGDGWLLAWSDVDRLFVDHLAAGESPPMDPMPVNADRPGNRGDVPGSFAGNAAGRGLLTWTRIASDDAPSAVLAQAFSGAGIALGAPVTAGESYGEAGPRACVMPAGGAAVVWARLPGPRSQAGASPAGVALRRLGPDGAPLGAAVTLAAPVVSEETGGPEATVACAGDGSFLVAWHTNLSPAKRGWDVVYQGFDKKGKARGKPQVLNSTTGGDQLRPAVVFHSDGTGLAVWESRDGGASLLRGRRIARNGKPQGTDFVLHTAAPGAVAERPQLARLPQTKSVALAWWEARVGWVRIFGQ